MNGDDGDDGDVRVLFVGGYGRSGSTIIDLLLDRVPGMVAVGEFRHLFGRALGDNELCSCGQPFRDCPRWSAIMRAAFPDGPDRARIQQAVRAINRVAVTPALLRPRLMTPTLRRHAAVYRDAFAAAYRAVADVTGADVVVDSTKYPMHGLFLRQVPGIDLAAMLLVRDPRAVALSWTRHRVRPEVHWTRTEMPRHSVVRSGLAWDMSNLLTRLIRTDRGAVRVQRYEDFVTDPQTQLSQIAGFAHGRQVTVDPTVFTSQPRVPHTIAGNPARFGDETIVVRSDDAWREQMSGWAKAAVTATTLPWLHRYGYRLRTPRPVT